MYINKDKLAATRENIFMNQFELSQASKIPLATIQRLEKIGGDVSKVWGERLALALSVLPADLTDDLPNSSDCNTAEPEVEPEVQVNGDNLVTEKKGFLLIAARRSLDQNPIPKLVRIDQITSMSIDFREPKIWIIYEIGNGSIGTATECFESSVECNEAWTNIIGKISKTNNVIRSDANGCDNES